MPIMMRDNDKVICAEAFCDHCRRNVNDKYVFTMMVERRDNMPREENWCFDCIKEFYSRRGIRVKLMFGKLFYSDALDSWCSNR